MLGLQSKSSLILCHQIVDSIAKYEKCFTKTYKVRYLILENNAAP
jgi:hypothetical protein